MHRERLRLYVSDKVASSYPLVTHSKEHVSQYDYMEQVENCINPLTNLPEAIVLQLAKMMSCSFSLFYVSYLVGINPFQAAFTTVFLCSMYFVVFKSIQRRWDLYVKQSSKLFSIRSFICNMTKEREVDPSILHQ